MCMMQNIGWHTPIILNCKEVVCQFQAYIIKEFFNDVKLLITGSWPNLANQQISAKKIIKKWVASIQKVSAKIFECWPETVEASKLILQYFQQSNDHFWNHWWWIRIKPPWSWDQTIACAVKILCFSMTGEIQDPKNRKSLLFFLFFFW